MSSRAYDLWVSKPPGLCAGSHPALLVGMSMNPIKSKLNKFSACLGGDKIDTSEDDKLWYGCLHLILRVG
jgi:hypothetical protein